MAAASPESGVDVLASAQVPAQPAGFEKVVVPVIQERVTVDKRVVETGGLRVRKVVAERDEIVDATTVREEFDVERIPVGRVIDAPVGVRQEGDVTIVPVVEERLVVETRLVLAEEIRITRRRQVHNASQTIRLRQEQVIVERRDAGSDQWRAVEVPGSSGSTGAAVADSEPPAAEVPTRWPRSSS